MAIIKYKDPVTEDYISVKTKTIDTLPVGSEVDYTGTSVPSGWTQVNELLWENPNTAVTDLFNAQDIILSKSWNKLLIVCRANYNDNTQITIPLAKGVTNQFTLSNSVFNYDSTKGSGVRVVSRFCSFNANDDKTLTIGQCYGQDIYGSGTNSLSNLQGFLVPLKIYKLGE